MGDELPWVDGRRFLFGRKKGACKRRKTEDQANIRTIERHGPCPGWLQGASEASPLS